MKKLAAPRVLFLSGFVLLLAVNSAVLSGVASNRSGDPDALVQLTERELRLPYRVHEENSGLSLRLLWRTMGTGEDEVYDSNWESPAWLHAEKLRELGFSVEEDAPFEAHPDRYKQPIARKVFIVLELGGEAYREALKRAEQALAKERGVSPITGGDADAPDRLKRAGERLERERTSESRLFAVDAGLEAGTLRKKYSDREHFIIAPGIVNMRRDYGDKGAGPSGYIAGLSVENIHVPLARRDVFHSIMDQPAAGPQEGKSPRYSVTLAYGSRLEPWILSVRRMEDSGRAETRP